MRAFVLAGSFLYSMLTLSLSLSPMTVNNTKIENILFTSIFFIIILKNIQLPRLVRILFIYFIPKR